MRKWLLVTVICLVSFVAGFLVAGQYGNLDLLSKKVGRYVKLDQEMKIEGKNLPPIVIPKDSILYYDSQYMNQANVSLRFVVEDSDINNRTHEIGANEGFAAYWYREPSTPK